MLSRVVANRHWDEEDEADDWDDREPECVAMVDDGFARASAFNGLWIHVRAQELRSGQVTALLAGVTVDLREAGLDPEGATLHVQGTLSGIDILVPPDWDIDCDVDAICSGVREQRRPTRSAEPRPRLRIRGTIVAGGLSVR